MEKIDLITKEFKDCVLYLNELYFDLKKDITSKEKKNLTIRIKSIDYVKSILKSLKDEYQNGDVLKKLEEVTKNNDVDFEKFKHFNGNMDDDDTLEYLKVTSLKSSLDLINENYLSKLEIYEYLNDYNEVMRLARSNLNIPIEKVFNNYMINTNQYYKANRDYYLKMIKIHILFVNISILSVTKDEDFEHLWATDEEMGEKTKDTGLSFLKDKFIITKDANSFKKTHIFNFIRNAFFHSDSNELYKISPDCNFVVISLKKTQPKPFNVKISANDIFKMVHLIEKFSHHVTAFELLNQEKIIVDDLFGHFHKCSKELEKVSLSRKVLPSNISDRKEDINKDLVVPDVIFSSSLFNNVLSNFGNVSEINYNFSLEQKRFLHSKFKYFEKYLSNIGMKYFVVPIIFNYMPGGIFKLNFLYFDLAVSYTYLFDGRNSMQEIMYDIGNDYEKLGRAGGSLNNKRSVFDYIDKNVDFSRYGLLYLFDDLEKENFDDVLLLKYVYGTINNEEKVNIGGVDYLSWNIRNVFTHNRWRGFVNQKGERCFYLYDDEDTLVDPDNAYWSATVLYSDLRDTTFDIVENYRKSLNSGLKK